MAKRIAVECTGHYDKHKTTMIMASILPTGYAFISNRQYRAAERRAHIISGDHLSFTPVSQDTWSATEDGWMTLINPVWTPEQEA